MKIKSATVSGTATSGLSDAELSIFDIFKSRLSVLGWTPVFDRRDEEKIYFKNLIPPPNATFSVMNPVTGDSRAIAFHFTEDGEDIRYVCTMELSNRNQAQEFGHFKKGAKTLSPLITHDAWRTPALGHAGRAPKDSIATRKSRPANARKGVGKRAMIGAADANNEEI